MLSTLRSEAPPVPILPQYLVASRASKANDSPAVLREDRLPGGAGQTDPSFASWQEMKLMHELKETVCEVYPRVWDDQ